MSAVEAGGCAPPVHAEVSDFAQASVLDRYVEGRAAELAHLQQLIDDGDVESYDRELSDLTRWHDEAVATRDAVAALQHAANELSRGMPLQFAVNARVIGNCNARQLENMRAALARLSTKPSPTTESPAGAGARPTGDL